MKQNNFDYNMMLSKVWTSICNDRGEFNLMRELDRIDSLKEMVLSYEEYCEALVYSDEVEEPLSKDEYVKNPKKKYTSEELENKKTEAVKRAEYRIKELQTICGHIIVCSGNHDDIVANVVEPIIASPSINKGLYVINEIEIKTISGGQLSYDFAKELPAPTKENGGLLVIEDFKSFLNLQYNANERCGIINALRRNPIGCTPTGWNVLVICSQQEETDWWQLRRGFDFKDEVDFI